MYDQSGTPYSVVSSVIFLEKKKSVFIFSSDYQYMDALWLFYKYDFLELIFPLKIYTWTENFRWIYQNFKQYLEKGFWLYLLGKCYRI